VSLVSAKLSTHADYWVKNKCSVQLTGYKISKIRTGVPRWFFFPWISNYKKIITLENIGPKWNRSSDAVLFINFIMSTRALRCVTSERWHLPTSSHSVITQKINIYIFRAARTSDFIHILLILHVMHVFFVPFGTALINSIQCNLRFTTTRPINSTMHRVTVRRHAAHASCRGPRLW
jgi:hypothetical protein